MRSRFQTERRMRDASRGIEVEVPFDNAFVKYLWTDKRLLCITEVSLTSKDPGTDTIPTTKASASTAPTTAVDIDSDTHVVIEQEEEDEASMNGSE